MTTKLVWRLKERPTPKEIIDLLEAKILKEDEAREILFSSETEEDRDKKSLESEVKFLRDLVEKLSNGQRTTIIETIKEVHVPYQKYPWYRPYEVWCSSGGNNIMLTAGNLDVQTSGLASMQNSSLSAGTGLNTSAMNFADIKTF
jgi:hypothetical protein